MHTQFDLEQSIMECWQVTDDIDTVYHNLDKLTQDELANVLLGLKTLYHLKFEKSFELYEQLTKEIHGYKTQSQ